MNPDSLKSIADPAFSLVYDSLYRSAEYTPVHGGPDISGLLWPAIIVVGVICLAFYGLICIIAGK